jgi:putative phage-type endonuclease
MKDPEHLGDRSKYLGGSEVAAIYGLSPYKTPVELWREKTGRAEREVFDVKKERILARGKRLEPVIIEMVIDKLTEQGHEVELLATNQRYKDALTPYLSCEIDFELLLDGEHINGDCKTVIGFQRKKWGEEETEEVPIHYAAQFMYGLGITGRQKCLVAALIGLDDVAIYWVYRDQETIDAITGKARDFWENCVLADVAPDPIKFDDIKLLYPNDNGRSVEATPEIKDKVNDLRIVKDSIKQLEEKAELLTLDIGEFISPHAALTFEGREIATWKGQGHSSIDQKALRAAHPGIVAEFTRSKTIRVLRLKKEA